MTILSQIGSEPLHRAQRDRKTGVPPHVAAVPGVLQPLFAVLDSRSALVHSIDAPADIPTVILTDGRGLIAAFIARLFTWRPDGRRYDRGEG